MTAGSFPWLLPGCAIDHVERNEQQVIIWAHLNSVLANCPTCEQSSQRVHSSYTRSPQDLPLGEQAVRVQLRVLRFRCSNPGCAQQVFVERLLELVPVYAQRTARLTKTIRSRSQRRFKRRRLVFSDGSAKMCKWHRPINSPSSSR